MSIDKRSFGERLTGLRNSQGFSQSELAARLGVTNRAVSKWETGAALPNLDTLDDLATLLGMSLSALMAETQSAGNAAAMIGLVGDEHEMYVATGVICDFYERLGWLVVRTSELPATTVAIVHTPQALLRTGCMDSARRSHAVSLFSWRSRK